MEIIDKFKENGLNAGRMMSYSKSKYKEENPNSICCFNANVLTLNNGKVWWGDLDITKDGDKLQKISEEIGEVLYVLREMDYRFENENDNVDKAISKAIFKTK